MSNVRIRDIVKRRKEAHKGDFGHVLIIAGSRCMSGASVLCGYGALRSGAGLVTIAIPRSIHPIVASQIMECMTLPLPETEDGGLHDGAIKHLVAFMETHRISAAVLGPGIGMDIETRMVVLGIINNLKCPGVLDADGLNHIAGTLAILNNAPAEWIITPHPGELSRLRKTTVREIQKDRKKAAVGAAKESGSVCVLKGSGTVITDGKKSIVNKTGNPGMATGGSGDILSGIIGGLLAQGMEPFEAARWGVFVHGAAGDYAVREKTEASLIARDIIEYIPAAFRNIKG